MEFVLKLKEFANFRENPKYPSSLCPTNPESYILVKNIIEQITTFHKKVGITHLHIGCDEVYHINECSLCKNMTNNSANGKAKLFFQHVNKTAHFIKSNYNTTPIIWDDMLRKFSKKEIMDSNLPNLVEIMAWSYVPDISKALNSSTWSIYNELFSGNIWGASAFKGATGSNRIVTNSSHHLLNHQSWVKNVENFFQERPLRGFVLTGWQRYDHFAVLCELLPVSIPNLVYNLIYIQNLQLSNSKVKSLALETLECIPDDHPRDFTKANFALNCSFPGNTVYESVIRFNNLKINISKILESNHNKGWMSSYNIKMSFTNPDHVRLATVLVPEKIKMLSEFEQEMYHTMSEIYQPTVASEWILTNVTPLKEQLMTLMEVAEKLFAPNVWPRRSLQHNL